MKRIKYIIAPVICVLLLNLSVAVKSELYSWFVVSNPIQDEVSALESVYFVNPHDGWAVGWGGHILHWNGAFWESIPSPVGYDLFSVYTVNSNDGWIVGAGGTILHWNGVSWSIVPSPTGVILRSVFMVSSDEGWAVAAEDRPRQTQILRWNGSAWSVMLSPSTNTLTSVFMVNSNDGWIVGEGGDILHWDGTS
jgi:photosystem II stability/assembly factor-like uncharacterized protein